jgi:hypothetical protein
MPDIYALVDKKVNLLTKTTLSVAKRTFGMTNRLFGQSAGLRPGTLPLSGVCTDK